jgi:hypothetical protein
VSRTIRLALGETCRIGLEKVRLAGIGRDSVELLINPVQAHSPDAWLRSLAEAMAQASLRDGVTYLILPAGIRSPVEGTPSRSPCAVLAEEATAEERRAAVARCIEGRVEWRWKE